MSTTITHQTAPTQFIDAAGIRFAYRRFGKKEGIPLVFMVHFIGTMDHWDPAITDGIATNREVILFNNAGISSTSGEVPESIDEMAAYAAAFIDALKIDKIDLLGISMGGLVAQQLTLDRPQLIRKLILVGTGPKGGEGMQSLTPEAQEIFGRTYKVPDELWLSVMFSPTESSQKEGRAFLDRFRTRKENRDPAVSDKVAPAQIAALVKAGVITDQRYEYLKQITQPTLVVNGKTDVIIYTINSFILQQHLPNAQLILYPDSNHGSLYQYHELFVESVNRFLGV
jgi:pimeloyl-ACP methyl ester carboxylesterase